MFKGLQSSENSLQYITLINNVASVGGTVYWVYDSTMKSEPMGIHSSTLNWMNNVAPYGLHVATQAIELVGPVTYDVTVYNSNLDPPISIKLYDYYHNWIPLQGSTSVIASIGTLIECADQTPSLAGNSMFGSGVPMSNGTAVFDSLQLIRCCS